MRIKDCSTTSHVYLNDVYLKQIDLLVVLETNDIKQLVFKLSSGNDDANENTRFEQTKVNSSLTILAGRGIRDPGFADFSALRSPDNFYLLFNKRFKIEPTPLGTSDVYLSDSKGTFAIVKQILDNNNNTQQLKVFVFENFTKEKAVHIKTRLNADKANPDDLFTGAILTKNYAYVVHSSRVKLAQSRVDESDDEEEDSASSRRRESLLYEYDNKSLCKHEIKERVDCIEVISRNTYLLCRRGIIEMYKIKCMDKLHLVKLVFSINSLSSKVTDMVFIG
jgi:hypothetical protein